MQGPEDLSTDGFSAWSPFKVGGPVSGRFRDVIVVVVVSDGSPPSRRSCRIPDFWEKL